MILFAAFAMAVQTTTGDIPPLATTIHADYEVGCDNRRDCKAVGFPPGDDPGTPGLIVGRAADPGAPLTVGIVLMIEGATLRIDGETVGTFDEDGRLVGGGKAAVDRLLFARSAQIHDKEGKLLGPVALDGLRGALAHFDRVQRGRGPVPGLPLVSPIDPPDRPARELGPKQIRAAQDRSGCTTLTSDYYPSFYRLDHKHSLALLPCHGKDRTLIATAWIVPDAGAPQPALIDWPFTLDPGGDPDREASLDYDSEVGRLIAEFRGVKPGGCMHDAVWNWDGRHFHLSDYREIRSCRGQREPIDLWRSRYPGE